MDFLDFREVRVSWIAEGEGYLYELKTDTLIVNKELNCLKFQIQELNREDDDLEIVIQRRSSGAHFFKTDYYESPEEELPLKVFTSKDELILFYDGRYGRAYFHIS